MKIGDKVLCKESVVEKAFEKRILFLKGAYYEVFSIDNNKSCRIFSIMVNHPLKFRLTDIGEYSPRFDKFFMTDREIRKEKLKKINENR